MAAVSRLLGAEMIGNSRHDDDCPDIVGGKAGDHAYLFQQVAKAEADRRITAGMHYL